MTRLAGMVRATPFFFGPVDSRLFGCHHSPDDGRRRPRAVVICAPIGQEHIRSHRALRRLAELAARAGFHVLRFDYFGCGDSSGDFADGEPERWRRDIAMAIAAARARSGLDRVCLVGLRFGAALAARVASERDDVEALALWEPVVSGDDYLRELVARHHARLVKLPTRRRTGGDLDDGGALGFPLTPALRASLARHDLLALRHRPARDVLVLDGGHGPDAGSLVTALERLGSVVTSRTGASQDMWIDDLDRVVVPHEPLETIVGWLEGGER